MRLLQKLVAHRSLLHLHLHKQNTSRVQYGKGEDNASMMAAVSEWDDNITKPVAEQMSMVRFLTDSL